MKMIIIMMIVFVGCLQFLLENRSSVDCYSDRLVVLMLIMMIVFVGCLHFLLENRSSIDCY